MNKIAIRLAKSEDLKHVQDLNHQLFLSDVQHFDDLNTNWPYEEGEKYFRDRIAGKNVIGGWSHLNFSAYKGKTCRAREYMCDRKRA